MKNSFGRIINFFVEGILFHLRLLFLHKRCYKKNINYILIQFKLMDAEQLLILVFLFLQGLASTVLCGLLSDGGNIQIIVLAMNMITLKGFKSYEDETLNNLHPRINIVLGRNGEGKSNFFKAINFVLTDRVACNRNEFNAYTHRALDNAAQPITVETYLRNRTGSGETELLCIERTWTPDLREEFKVEGQSFQKEEVENYLESLGIAYSNPYHIVQQGRIDHIVRMDDFELYGLLEDATGLRKYERRYEEALGHFRKNAIQKEEIASMLGEIESRLKIYQGRKEEYELHNCSELHQKLLSKQEFENQLDANARKLEDVKHNEHRMSEELGRMRNKAKNMREDLEQLQQEIAVNQRQLYECQANPEDEELQHAPIASQQLHDINSRLKKTGDAKNKLKAEWQRKSKDTEAARKEMEAHKARFSGIASQLEGEKLAKTGKGKAEVRATIDRLQQSIIETEDDMKKMSSYLKEFKVGNGMKEAQEEKALKEKLSGVALQLKAAKMKIFEENRVRNQLQAQIEALGQQSNAYLHRLRKALPLLDLGLLRELRRQKVDGVLGYLLQYVQIDPAVAFAYEMAGAQRLCTLLVEDQSACAKVIEVNRRMKGKQINMLPLSVLRRQPAEKHNAPNNADCHSLINEEWLRIRPHGQGEEFQRQIRKLLNNTFGKYLLVETYQLALDVSKRYHLNCITGDREVVYSEGFFCKVGRDEAQEDRLQLYFRLADKEKLIDEAQKKLTLSGKQFQVLQNVELQLSKRRVALEGDSAAVTRKLDQIAYQKRAVAKVQEQVDNLERKRTALQSELKRTQQMLAAIESKKGLAPVNPREYKELEELYNERLRVYNQRSEEQYAVERRLEAVAREEEELAQQAAKLKQEADFNKSFSADYVNEREYRQRLDRSLQEREKRALELQKELFVVQEQVGEGQVRVGEAVAQVTLIQEQLRYYQERIAELGAIEMSLEQVEERSNSLSMSFSHMYGKRRHFYTAKEKLFFGKIDLHRRQLNEKRALYEQLLQAEAKLTRMMDQCQHEKQQYVSQIFKKFQAHFGNVFRAITGGNSDVRLKKNHQRVNGPAANREKFRNAMTIMVSFESQREVTRRWNEFSGGQKSVLAFCVLMALQRCQPAPFYVLDQVDSALDPQYLRRIVDLIRSESQHAQFFISSFKQEMLDFPEDCCNFYLVRMVDRVSKIGRIDPAEAKRSLANIAQ